MENFSRIINWENVFKESKSFQNQKPFRFAFIREFFHREFYDQLFEGYPNMNTFEDGSDLSRAQFSKTWGRFGEHDIVENESDSNFNEAWNKFQRYSCTTEFIDNFRKFSGIPVNRRKFFHFISYKLGGFQFPHIHDVGPSTLILFSYFSKGWKKGDPGGTYMAKTLDESSILFEPDDLDNTMAIFHDSPHSVHGVRYIIKDAERRAQATVLEEYSDETGWSGGNPKEIIDTRKNNGIGL
jgi:hypothetical protein